MKRPLDDLLIRVRTATGPDHRLNWDLWWYCAANSGAGNSNAPPEDYERDHWRSAPRYITSIDEASFLAERVLPGWWYSVCRCWLSDDASIAPDFNSPKHGARLICELGPIEARSIWDNGFHVDRRPPGSLPLALIEAILMALIALDARKNQDDA